MLYAPALVADNHAIGRDIAVTERARDELADAYGPLLPIERDPRVSTPTLTETVGALAPGTRYALCVLEPSRDSAVDRGDVASAVRVLTAGSAEMPVDGYATIAGLAGQTPQLVAGSSEPFRRMISIANVAVEIRMESWLDFDTIRRMGFGHVVAARRHTLIVERGVSFVAFDANGHSIQTAYRSNIFAPQPRYLVRQTAETP